MFINIKRKRTIPEKLLICSLIALHINLILPIADVLPLPKAIKKAILPEALADEPPPPPSWRVVEVHDGSDPSIAIDSLGKSNIAFAQDTGDLRGDPTHIFYGYKGSGTWTINEITPTIVKPEACAETSIALDVNDNVHIAYALEWGERVSYITNKSGDWQETIITGKWTGNYESFYIDENGGVNLFWWNNTAVPPPPYPKQLCYKYNNGSNWLDTEGLDEDLDLNVKRYINNFCPSALAAEHGSSAPHTIVGNGAAEGGLIHCYKNGTTWYSETFGAGYEILFDANGTLQVDSSNNLYCVIQNASGTKSLYLANKISSDWSYELITQLVAGSTVRASLVIDPQDNLHIAYFNGQKVYYGKQTAGIWVLQEVTTISGGATPAGISLALNSSGWPRIAYSATSTTAKKIYYADWDIHPPNEPPVIDPIPDKSVNENKLLTFPILAHDDPEDILTYSLVSIPGKNFPNGAIVNSETGVFEWTPTYQQAGYYELNTKVSDGEGGETLALIKITVLNVNTTPTVLITSNPLCVTPGTDFTLHITANDEDGDNLTYVLKENNITIQTGTIIHGEQLPDITRNKGTMGIYTYLVTVSDPALTSATASCSVEVIDPNEDPTKSFPISGDFNGDGMTDIGAFNTEAGSWKVSISDKGEFNSLQEWMSNFKGKDADHAYSLTGDFNGDGRVDIVSYDTQGGDWKFAFSNGTAFINNVAWDLTKFGGGAFSPLIGDYNGDGVTDIGYADAMSNNDGFFCIRLAKKDRTGFVDTAIPYDNGLPGSATYAGDFNGDGLTDILAFDRGAGKWNVRLSQDTTSTQYVNLIEDHDYTSLTQTGGNASGEGKQRDGDFWTAYEGYSWVPEHGTSVDLTSTFTFQTPAHLKRIVFKQGALCGGNLVTGYPGHVKLYYSSGGAEIISEAVDSVCSLDGDWPDVTKIEMYIHAFGDGGDPNNYGGDSPADAHAYQHELQAWGFAEPALAAGSLPAFTESTTWLDNFGADQEAIITDYNHDGKTDIGYFDATTGRWQFAVSSGTGFESMIRATTGRINNGSHANVYDGDWDTWVGFYDGGTYGSKSSTTTTVFEWPETYISSVKYKCRSYSAIGGSGSHWNNWDVYLKINGVWSSIDNGSGDSGIRTKSNGWADCGGIKMVTRASADSNRECAIETKNYELQAFETLSDGSEVNKAVDENWPSPLGQGSNVLPSGGDYNGDGIGDASVFDRSAQGVLNKWNIKLHNSKQPDLLISVDNGIGGTTDIEYGVSTQFDNTGSDGKPDLPFPVPVVTSVTKTDGMGNSYSVSHDYKEGFYEPDSREFRGFGYVEVSDSEGTVKYTWFNQNDIYKGRPDMEQVNDAQGNVYSLAQYWWNSKTLYSGSVTFPYLEARENVTTDGGITKTTRTEYGIPDDYGNVTEVKEWGEYAGPTNDGDERYTYVEYAYNTTDWILNKPKTTYITDSAGTTVSQTWYYYDNMANGDTPVKGALTKEEKWLSDGANPTTQFTYDDYGNIQTTVDARNKITTTVYDTNMRTFPMSVQNHLGHIQQFTYDYATGQILTSTDPNNQVTETIYDGFGRIQKIVGPNDTANDPGIEYVYGLDLRPVRITTITKVDGDSVPITYTTSYAFIDGLGRTIEVKTPAEDTTQQLISGIVKYDSRGQVKEKYLSYFAQKSPDYVPPTYAQKKVIYEYDPVGRITKATQPDGVFSRAEYEGWAVTSYDGNGNKIKSEKDAYGQLIKITEYNDEDNGSAYEEYVTQYKYDTLGNLKETIDAQQNKTIITYDTLGRKRTMKDSDMGGFAGKTWQYVYDEVGNLRFQTDAEDQVIEFIYDDINRLTSKSTGVTYVYDEAGKANCVGRLSKVTDSSGMTEFFYDILGREERTIKTINGAPNSYVIERAYDSLDRLKTVKYPDTEVITYTYNEAGGIETVSGNQSYVTNVDYNENGQMARVDYGNGTCTDYTYNTNTLRLEHFATQSPTATIQDLSYTFDNVGNVLSIADAIPGSTNSQIFQYDDLNRLTNATGDGYGTKAYTYDSIGNMIAKGDVSMQYGVAAGPHAVTSYQQSAVSYQLTYDANGNMTTKEYEGGVKHFTYDIENRLSEAGTPKEEWISNHNITLNPGWNFVSIPLIVTNDIPTILQASGITKAEIAQYDAATQSWKSFAYEQGQNLSQYSDFNNFEYGKGYEIYVEQAGNLTVSSSTPLSDKTLELYSGWNLIAAPTTQDLIPAAEALAGVTYTAVKYYNGSSYQDATQLESGKAYFVEVATPQTWNIPREQNLTTFVYDGDGGRVRRMYASAGVTDITTYIGSSYEINTSGVSEGLPGGVSTVIKKHIFMGSTRICTVEDNGTTIKYRYFHQDHIGSSNVITDETGQTAQLLEYSPYGLTAREEGSYNTSYRFTGQLFDTSTELYYYGARYYDPDLGRFITPDTIVPYPDDPQSFNRYAYARNNPIRYIDPSGHSWWDSFKKWIGHIVGAIAGVAATIMSGGNVLAGFQVYSFASGMINAGIGAISGDWSGVGAGIGGMIGSVVGWNAGVSGAALLSDAVPRFVVGAVEGAIEFGASGFGAGFGYGIGGGSSFRDATMTGLIMGGVSAVAGAVIEGSYIAGWQSILHGATVEDIAAEKAQRWGSKFLEERVPTYGNYGGPGHGDPTFKKEPIDQMDAYFMNHDKMWTRGRANIADKVLRVQLQGLPEDPSQWKPPAPDVNEARRYRSWAERYFKFISTSRNNKDTIGYIIYGK